MASAAGGALSCAHPACGRLLVRCTQVKGRPWGHRRPWRRRLEHKWKKKRRLSKDVDEGGVQEAKVS